MNRKTSLSAANLTDEELLELYLSLPKKQREERFTDTAHAAEIVGLAIRTIEFWIESGEVQAVIIGRKYRVDLDSLRAYLKERMRRHES